jgi:hypothetical protein
LLIALFVGNIGIIKFKNNSLNLFTFEQADIHNKFISIVFTIDNILFLNLIFEYFCFLETKIFIPIINVKIESL